MVATRRSARLQQLRSTSTSDGPSSRGGRAVTKGRARKRDERPQAVGPKKKKNKADEAIVDAGGVKRRRTPRAATSAKKKLAVDKNVSAKETISEGVVCLPRTRERALRSKREDEGGAALLVMGVDEAGRGPLAGPVVAAAAIVPVDIPGVTDSKKITSEEAREELYEKIVTCPGSRWAAAVIDAPTIDEINILQATLRGMKLAVEAVMQPPPVGDDMRAEFVSMERKGCYVVCGQIDKDGEAVSETFFLNGDDKASGQSYYALVDGNRVPPDMPCDCEAVVKGDSREFAIGAASVIAKVTRDRLMRQYDERYPEYELGRHKGYPTKAHMAAVHRHGASPIHRRTFAPLKHMAFDERGRVVVDSGGEQSEIEG